MLRRKLLFALTSMLCLGGVAGMAAVQNQRREPNPLRGKRRPPDRLKVGDAAPDFKLKSLDGKLTVQLSRFRRQDRPVALIFGSYT